MIQTILHKVQSMMIDFQIFLLSGVEVVNTGVYLHQQTPKEGLTKQTIATGLKHHAQLEMNWFMYLACPLRTMMAIIYCTRLIFNNLIICELSQLTYLLITTPLRIQPKVQAIYKGKLLVGFDYTLNDMGSSIPTSKITV